MPVAGKLWGWLGAFLALSLAAGAGLGVLLRSAAFEGWAAGVVSRWFAQGLGREATVQGVQVDAGGLTLKQVRLPGLVRAERVRVDWDLRELVREVSAGRTGLQAVRRVSVHRPHVVLVRDARGRWNVEAFARAPAAPPPGPAERPTLEVYVREGTVQLVDRSAGGFRAAATRWHGRARLADFPVLRFHAQADLIPGGPGRVQARGWVDVQHGVVDLDVAFRGLGAAAWLGPLSADPRVRWESGRLAGRLQASGPLAAPYVRGTVQLDAVSVRLVRERLRLWDVRGEVAVDGPRLVLRGVQVRAGGGQVQASGEVRLAGEGAVQLDLRFHGAELAHLHRLVGLPVQGRATGTVAVRGLLSTPRVSSQVSSARVQVASEAIRDVKARVEYAGGLVSLSADVRLRGGSGRVQAVLGLEDPYPLVADVDVRRVDAALATVLGFPLPVHGPVTGSLLLAGPVSDLAVAVASSGGPGTVLGQPVREWAAVLDYSAGAVEVLAARAGRGSTWLAGWGRVRADSLDVHALARGVALQEVLGQAGIAVPSSGTVDAAGRVRGTVGAPVFTGTVRLGEGSAGPLRWDEAVAGVRVSPYTLHVADLRWRDGPDPYRAEGRADLRARSARLRLHAAGARVNRVLQLAGVDPVASGEVRAELDVDAARDRLSASGFADAWDLRAGGWVFSRARARFRWQEGRLVVDESWFRSPAAQVHVSGQVTQAGRLQLQAVGEAVHLEQVGQLRNPHLRLEGSVRVEGTVHGTVRQPSVDAEVQGSGVRVNGQRFDTVLGRVRWSRGLLEALPLQLRRRASVYTVRGGLQLSGDPVADLHLDVQDAQVATLLAVAGIPAEADGRLSGRLTLSGPLSKPRAELDVVLADGTFRGYRFPSGTGRVVLQDGQVQLEQVELVAGQGRLRAAGTVDVRGNSEVEVAGVGLEAQAVSSLLRLRTPLVGTLDFTVQLAGNLQDPVAGLALEAKQVGWTGGQADRLTAQAFYRAGFLELEQLLVEEQGYRLRARGRLPLRRGGLEPDPQGPVDFLASTDRADLGILRLLPFVESAEGPVEAALRVAGTVANPVLEGFVRADGGRVKLAGLSPALEGVQLDLAFDHASASLRGFRAQLGPGELAATGQASFEGLRLHRYELAASARGARVELTPYFRGALDGRVELVGTAQRARASGRLVLSAGELVAASPPPAADSRAVGIPLELDLELAAGEGLSVVAGPVRLQVQGGLRVSGTADRPALSGTVTGRGGEYRAFGTTFTVEEGTAVFQEFRGTEPLLAARASTRVGDVTVFVHLAGTPGQMQVRLSSEPELPYDRIVQLLAAQAGIQRALGGEVEAALRQQLARFLLGEVERRVRQLLGLAELRIEYDFEKPLRLQLGRFLLRDLYLTLTTVFDTQTRWLWALEYRFARHYALAFSHDPAGVWMVLLRGNFAW